MDIIDYPNREELFADLANILAGELRGQLARNDRASLAVPGGTTPGPVFDVLAETQLDWGRVDVLLTDERWVPGDHPRSNTGLLYERLLTDYAAHANYIPLYTGDDPETGAGILAGQVATILPLTVVMLGMGADMHTASLFPGAENLAEAMAPDAPAVLAMKGGTAPEPRVSLSAAALNTASVKHLVITGADKRAALEKAQELNDPLIAPICAVLDNMTIHWAE